MGSPQRKIVHVKRGRVLDFAGGRRFRWEVEIAEGVDLLLVSFFFFFEVPPFCDLMDLGFESSRVYGLSKWS